MSKKQQARLQRAKERFQDAVDDWREQTERMKEDLRFSNPILPEQWSAEARGLRGARPMLTFDNTHKFIAQVVNDGAASPPSIQTVPADGFAHEKAADAFNGRIRHIEYVSRAQLAYNTALDLSARCGLGWIHCRPEITDPELNQQEPRIIRIKSPLECLLEAGWQEPDGSDAEHGFVLTTMHAKKFKIAYPKAKAASGWSDPLWVTPDSITIAQYFEIIKINIRKMLVQMPDGEQIAMTEDEYWETAQAIGTQPMVVHNDKGEPATFDVEERSVEWSKLCGDDDLEDPVEFPSKYIPIVPVIGNELWVDGKRYLGGLTRQLMDGQRMHNAEMSAYTESILSQPKAPFMVPIKGIEGHMQAWSKLNSGNPAFLPFNHVDDDGQPIPMPQRIAPPQMPGAFAQGAVMGTTAMQNAVGVFKSGLGQDTPNAVSGIAKQQDRRESNTATFHYTNNRAISLQHLGRILLDMDRRLTDTARTVRTMGEDGNAGRVRFDPNIPMAVQMRGSSVEAINPRIGEYDLRVKVGPSYLTQNEETATELAAMFQGAPQLLPVLGPLWIKLKGVPDADTIKKLLVAMAPPQIQQVYADQESKQQDPIPPQAKAMIDKLQSQVQQLSVALQHAAAEADKTQVEREKSRGEREKAEAEMLTEGYRAVTDRLKVTMPQTPVSPDLLAMIQQTIRDAIQIAPTEPQPFSAEPNPPQFHPQLQQMLQPPQNQPMMPGQPVGGEPQASDAGFDAPSQPANMELPS